MSPTVEDLVRASEPGEMHYDFVEYEGGPKDGARYVALLVRETPARIRTLGQYPVIELRAASFTEQNVIVVVVLMKVRGETYETWWNYWQTGGGQDYFDGMRRQAALPILFFTARSCERRLRVTNNLDSFFEQATRAIAERPAWTMEDFDRARRVIEGRYPSVAALWRALGAHVHLRLIAN